MTMVFVRRVIGHYFFHSFSHTHWFKTNSLGGISRTTYLYPLFFSRSEVCWMVDAPFYLFLFGLKHHSSSSVTNHDEEEPTAARSVAASAATAAGRSIHLFSLRVPLHLGHFWVLHAPTTRR